MTGGTLNKNGSLVMVATRVGAEGVLAQIVDMVSSARQSQAPLQGMSAVSVIANALRLRRVAL